MIAIRFRPQASNISQAYEYRVAAHRVISDVRLAGLASFALGAAKPRAERLSPAGAAEPDEAYKGAELVFSGEGLVAGKERRVECRCAAAGYKLSIDEIGSFTIRADGKLAESLEPLPSANLNLLAEAFQGPVLTLMLAMQNTFCLHASAVAIDDRVIAFVGESGRGKSTLARFARSCGDKSLRRMADDVLPVEIHPSGPVALPHFPQIKLKDEDQVAMSHPEQMRLGAVYLIDQAAEGEAQIAISSMSARESVLTLVRHTHAARLFNRNLLARHLELCGQMSARVAVRRLSYPRDYSLLPRVLEGVRRDLELTLREDEAVRDDEIGERAKSYA